MGFKLFAGKSVRRNVTLDGNVATTLETLSRISGLTQGSLIEMGLRQPFMNKLMVFASDQTESPIAEVMDIYQSAGEAQMTREITAGFVRVLRDDILTRPLRFCVDTRVTDGLNHYIAEHIHSRDVYTLPGFFELRDLAERGEFIDCRSESGLNRSVEHVKEYLLAMQLHMDKSKVYANDFLVRNLVVMFRDFIVGVADPADDLERRAYYYQCCSGVLSMMFPSGGGFGGNGAD